MIILKHNDTVYIAKCRDGFMDHEAARMGTPIEENLCIWHPNKRKNRLVATIRNHRFTDIIRYENIFPKTLNPKHVAFDTFDKLYELADKFDLCGDGFLPMRTVFAEGDKAYLLYSDGGQLEVEGIHAACRGERLVMALYDVLGVNDPYEFIKTAYRTIEQTINVTMFPVVVMNTKNNKIEVINR